MGQAFLFDASYSREKRDGNKNTTFYGGPSYEVATPIDYVTDNFRFGGEFAKGRFFLAASVDFSEFKNEVPYVEIDNPERLQMANPTNGRNVVNDAAFFRLWMPPDNEAYQADFTGGLSLPARHKITGVAVHRQHEDGDGAPRALDQPQPADERDARPTRPSRSSRPTATSRPSTTRSWPRCGSPATRSAGSATTCPTASSSSTTRPRTTPSRARSAATWAPPYSAAGFTREHEGWGIESTRALVYVTPVRGLRLGVSYGQDKRTYDIREYADVEDDVWTLSADYNSSLFQLHGAWSTPRPQAGRDATRMPSRRAGRARPRPTSPSARGTS